MPKFALFDSVILTEAVRLSDKASASSGTPGSVVEILGGGEAYFVELFGGWVRLGEEGETVPSNAADPLAF